MQPFSFRTAVVADKESLLCRYIFVRAKNRCPRATPGIPLLPCHPELRLCGVDVLMALRAEFGMTGFFYYHSWEGWRVFD